MAKTVYVGHIRNELYETKTLVVAENAEDARAKVLEKLSNHLGTLYQEQDLQIKPFALGYTQPIFLLVTWGYLFMLS